MCPWLYQVKYNTKLLCHHLPDILLTYSFVSGRGGGGGGGGNLFHQVRAVHFVIIEFLHVL